MSKIKNFLLSSLLFIAGLLVVNLSYAQCSTASDPVSITGNPCPNVVISANKADVTVQAGAQVGTTFGSGNPALSIINVTVGNLNNSGLIQGQSANTSGIDIGGTSVVRNINNTAEINGSKYAIQIYDSAAIGRINNIGSIINCASCGASFYPNIGILLRPTASGSPSITTIDNFSTIGGTNGAIYLDTANNGHSASIGTINNSGSINGGQDAGILVGTGDSIGIINNNAGGEIRTGACNGLGCYNSIQNWGTITEINNNGLILGSSGFGFIGYGIENNGTIITLNNAQTNLTYTGTLPTNYNVVISSLTNYGKISVANPLGTTNFGIASSSSLTPNATYSNVVTGVTVSSFTGGAVPSGIFGTGAVVTPVSWTLTNGGSGTNWSLEASNSPVKSAGPRVNRSLAGTSLVAGIATVAAAASNGGANPTLANGTTLAAAAQNLTSSQVNQLINVHAEGYSSNMTIGLEQMAHITNTVMDRIHAPMSSSPTTKVYQDDEGRYVWADAAAVKGTVNNYNNLAGFGYNLYDLIIGGDIKRTKDGGYGVFAGVGSTSMTESQQVTQNFNTTNFYAGLYGALNFTEQVKLSGALGYMYGNTNANRSTPNVGLFTGGNATSSYKTNGMYAAGKLAKAYQFEDITISPFVGASYSQLWMGGATEQGGNDFNFAINSATAYTAVTFAGADFVYPLMKGTNSPLSLVGFYKFGYDWFANSNSAHSITAVSPIYGSFTQVGANMGPVSNMFGLGIQGGITKDVSARIGVVASVNSYGQEYGGGAELRFKF